LIVMCVNFKINVKDVENIVNEIDYSH